MFFVFNSAGEKMKYLIRVSEGHDTNFAIDSFVVDSVDQEKMQEILEQFDDEFYTVRISIFKA